MSNTPMAANPLTRAVLEIDEYASGLGWDQSARLFALVDTARLRAQEPGLAAQLGLRDEPETTGLTPIEQEEIPAGKPLDEFLGTIAWPDAVVGCALTVERLMLPPSAEASVPEGLSEKKLTQWVAQHPDRQEVRMTVAVLRDGTRDSALRLREKDSPRRSSRAAPWSPASRRPCRRPSRTDLVRYDSGSLPTTPGAPSA